VCGWCWVVDVHEEPALYGARVACNPEPYAQNGSISSIEGGNGRSGQDDLGGKQLKHLPSIFALKKIEPADLSFEI